MANRYFNERQTLRTFYGVGWRFVLTLSFAVWLVIMVSVIADWPFVAVLPGLFVLVNVATWFRASRVRDRRPPEHTEPSAEPDDGTPTG